MHIVSEWKTHLLIIFTDFVELKHAYVFSIAFHTKRSLWILHIKPLMAYIIHVIDSGRNNNKEMSLWIKLS